MSGDSTPKGVTVLSNGLLNKRISQAKKVRLRLTTQQAREILSKGGYKLDGKTLVNEDGTPVFGIDGSPVTTKSFAALLAGSNVFVPKNIAALFKHFIEKSG